MNCPVCQTKGRPVQFVTLESLLTEEAKERVSNFEGYRYCSSPSCEIAYFHPDNGSRFTKEDVRVRIGMKETDSPRPICYCFDHTIEEIETQVAKTGNSVIPEEIAEKCRQGLDRCEEENPQGHCCLGNIQMVVKGVELKPEACCASEVEDTVPSTEVPKGGLLASGGAIGTAVLSTACCWLPLLFLLFGASAAGVSGFIETYRPVMLGFSGVFLGLGFYLVYFRKPSCEPGTECSTQGVGMARINKAMLWVAAIVVGVAVLFPNFAGIIPSDVASKDTGNVEPPKDAKDVTLLISGMT